MAFGTLEKDFARFKLHSISKHLINAMIYAQFFIIPLVVPPNIVIYVLLQLLIVKYAHHKLNALCAKIHLLFLRILRQVGHIADVKQSSM